MRQTEEEPRGTGVTVASSASGPRPAPSQIELFGMAIGANDQTTICAPCRQCLTTVAVIGPGSGPHYKSLYCLRGYFQTWLPRPRPRRGADEHRGLGGRVSIPGLGAYPDTVARKESGL